MKNLRKKKIDIFLTAIVICVSLVAVSLIYVPKLLKLEMYAIRTDSMSPTIKSGSLVSVRRFKDISECSVGDIVTFTDEESGKSFTHRVVKINDESHSFITKGDANETEDPVPTDFSLAVGKVEFIIPFVGYLTVLLEKRITKIAIALIYIAWIAIEIEIFLQKGRIRHD